MNLAHRVQACFQAFERKDRAAWAALCAPDAVLGGLAHESPVTRQAALSERFERIGASSATFHFELVAVHVALLNAAAVFKRNVVGANGKTASAEGIVAFAADTNGRFTRIAGFWNPALVFAAAMA
jgi:ketosteroid isomerase-like protein